MSLMSLFQKVKAGRPPAEPDVPLIPSVFEAAVATLKVFCDDVRRLCPEAFAGNGPGLTVLSCYAYGGLIVLAEQRGYLPSHALSIYRELLRGVFGDVGAFEGAGVARAETVFKHSKNPSSVLYPIMHRGALEFRNWQKQREAFDAADFKRLLAENPFSFRDHNGSA